MDKGPKLRTFKLFVTEPLPELGATLAKMNNSLEHVTLVYPTHQSSLTGLQQFLSACGGRISQLEVECSPHTLVKPADLTAIASHCPQVESLTFSNHHVGELDEDNRGAVSPVPSKPAHPGPKHQCKERQVGEKLKSKS